MSEASAFYTPTAFAGHLSLADHIEAEEAAFSDRRLTAIREFRAARDTFAAAVRGLDAEDIDPSLGHYDRACVLELLADLDAPVLTDAEICDMAVEAYWDAQREYAA